MLFQWLKRYMPRGLYGRAALILILPVVTVQLIVSYVFIQRHFEGVTVQMTRSVSLEINLMLDLVDAAPDRAAAEAALAGIAEPLEYTVQFVAPGAVPAADMRRWWDFSGLYVRRQLRETVPEMAVLILPDDREVMLYLDTAKGPMVAEFSRRRLSASNPHQLLVNMVVFGILMTLIAFIYLRNQLRPIARLARAAEAYGRGRNEPYHPSGATEVRAAGHAFLDMRARIDRHIEQRTMMLSGVSHDLRTPLTRLRLGLEMLDDDETRKGLLADVEEMQRMLDGFLDFARGEAEGAPEPTDAVALVREAVDDASRGGCDVRLADVEGAGEVKLRPAAIRRALDNLLANALRHGTRAEVSLRVSDRSLRIRVEDDGPGIPEDQRDEAVKPFTRLDPARNQDRGGGVGLGLAITADIARAHGGVLRLGASERLGGLQADLVIGA